MFTAFSHIIVTWIIALPQWLGVIVVALFSFAEGVPIIGSILPGGTIALLTGSMSSVGFMSPLFAGIIIAISSFGGDMTGFLLGKRFRHWKPIQRLVDHEKYQKSWDLFDRHIALITIFGKLIPVVRSTPSLFAAVRGIPARRYMLYSFLGSVLWAFAGVYAGNFLTALLGDNAIAIILGILVLSIIIIAIRFFLIKKRKSQHRKSDNRNNNVPSE